MNVRVAFEAPTTPPDIGVSQNLRPRLLAVLANSFEPIGEIVLVSQIIVFGAALAKTPPSSLSTESTIYVFGKAVTT